MTGTFCSLTTNVTFKFCHLLPFAKVGQSTRGVRTCRGLVNGKEGLHPPEDVVVDMAMEEPDSRVIGDHLQINEGAW